MDQLQKEFDLDITWVHFPLHPETPEEGRRLEDLFAGRSVDVAEMQAQMAARMQAEGLPYGNRTHTYNSRLAQEFAKWAEAEGASEEIHAALFASYFVAGENIGDADVLLSIADSLGLDRERASAMILHRTFRPAVDEDWAKSRRYGVTGVPTFVAGGYAVIGAQPYETLAALIQHAQPGGASA